MRINNSLCRKFAIWISKLKSLKGKIMISNKEALILYLLNKRISAFVELAYLYIINFPFF